MTVMENGPRLVRTTVSSAWALSLRDDLARDDFASRVFPAEIFGKLPGQLVQVGVAVGMGQHQKIVGPDAVGRPIGEEERHLAGSEHRAPSLSGRSSANLYSR